MAATRHCFQRICGLIYFTAQKHDWSGFYIGGNIGYDIWRSGGVTTASDGTTNTYIFDESAEFTAENASNGLQVGYNYQFQNGIVAGFEADISRPNLTSARRSFTDGSERVGSQLQVAIQYDYDWWVGIKGKLGYSFNNVVFLWHGRSRASP